MKKNTSRIQLLVVFLLLLGVGVTALVVSQKGTSQFDIRKRASAPSGTATLTLETSSTQRYIGDVFPVKVMLNTADTPISGVALRLSYPFTGTTPEIEVVDADPSTTGVQIESHASSLSLTTNVNSVVRQPESNGNVFIDFSATTTSPTGFSNSQPQLLATIKLKANKAISRSINHDPIRSQITRKSDGLDILLSIPAFSLTVIADTAAPTVTITSGLENGVTATSSAVMFSWTGTDNPPRPSDTSVPLLYSYQFDSTNWTDFLSATTITKTLTHGAHTFKVRAKDLSGNINTPSAPGSSRSFTLNLTKLQIVFPLQGITQNRDTKKVTVVLKRGSYIQRFDNVDAAWNTTESAYMVSLGPLTRPFTTASDYTASIDDSSRLRRRYTNLTFTNGVLNIIKKKAATDALLVADFSDDNKLNIEDFGLLMSKITALTTPVTSSIQKFDLNADGTLDISDIGLLLANYTSLEKIGDPE